MKKNLTFFFVFLAAVFLISYLVSTKRPSAENPGSPSSEISTADLAGFGSSPDSSGATQEDGSAVPVVEEAFSFTPTIPATLAGTALHLMKADTDSVREHGLADLESIPDGTGMFYVFDSPDYLSYWMKGMKFATDMMWLDQSYKVVSIEKNISPATYPEVFTPKVLAQYMLEVPANFVAKHGIKVGDKLSF